MLLVFVECWPEKARKKCNNYANYAKIVFTVKCSGNNLVGVNSCDNKRDPLAVELMRDNVNARAHIVKKQTDFTVSN